jgi:DNA ligase (NAD+)
VHNANEIERLDLRIGDTVFVEKGGEIIPKITGVDLSKRDPKSQKIEYIKSCPDCGSELVRKDGEANHFCMNSDNCATQMKGKLEHFLQRKAMNLDSLGEGKIEVLFDSGLVTTIDDLYKLTFEDLLGLTKTTTDTTTGKSRKVSFQQKTVENILSGVQNSKNIPFKQVLFGMGIRYVGATVAEKLVAHFGTIGNLIVANYETLIEVPEIGERIAKSIIEHFSIEKNLLIVENLKNAGLQFEATIEEKISEGEALNNKNLLYTGTFSTMSRDEIEYKIVANGGKLVSSVSAKLDYLIVGEKPGASKLEKAEKFKTIQITEEEFLKMIQ